jgi:hypothetical protein
MASSLPQYFLAP